MTDSSKTVNAMNGLRNGPYFTMSMAKAGMNMNLVRLTPATMRPTRNGWSLELEGSELETEDEDEDADL